MNQHARLAAAGAGGRSIAGPAALLAVATAVVVTTEFIVVGLLPEMARDLAISVVEAGWFVSAFAIASAVFGPLLTVAVGKAEPRTVFVATLTVFAIGNLVAVAAPTYPVVLAVRIVEGAALPVLVSVGSAVLARLAGPGREGEAVGLLYLGVVVAIVVAVPAGVLLAERSGWRSSFVALAAVAGLAAAVLGLAFPRLGASDEMPVRAQAGILRSRALHAHLLLSAVLATAMFAAYTYLAAFLEVVAGFDGRGIALALMGFGIAGVLGNSIAGRVVDRGPTMATAVASLLLMVATAAASLAGGALVLLLPVLAVWGAVHTAAFLLCQVRVMIAAPAAPAFASALNISAGNVGIAAGAVVGGVVIDQLGIAAIGYGGAALAAFALAIAVRLLRAGDR